MSVKIFKQLPLIEIACALIAAIKWIQAARANLTAEAGIFGAVVGFFVALFVVSISATIAEIIKNK